MNKTKIGITDDYAILRTLISNALKEQKDFEVILEASNGKDLLEQLENSQPDIVLMDIQMPIMNGIEASQKVKERFPQVKVIAFSQHDLESNIIEMNIQGVKSFISKEDGPTELIKAIRIVSQGGVYMTDYAAEIIQRNLNVKKMADLPNQQATIPLEIDLISKLSNSELKILQLISRRLSIKEIAKKLFLSPNTINNKQAALRKKLNLNGRGKLLPFALSIRDYLVDINNQVENR